ncbi:MAG TPA: hypothetical protein VIY08_13425 [Candidatus Nitrosocosmicus sp.]
MQPVEYQPALPPPIQPSTPFPLHISKVLSQPALPLLLPIDKGIQNNNKEGVWEGEKLSKGVTIPCDSEDVLEAYYKKKVWLNEDTDHLNSIFNNRNIILCKNQKDIENNKD